MGYYQNQLKAIKEDVIWTGTYWKFEIDEPCGSYLSGHEEAQQALKHHEEMTFSDEEINSFLPQEPGRE